MLRKKTIRKITAVMNETDILSAFKFLCLREKKRPHQDSNLESPDTRATGPYIVQVLFFNSYVMLTIIYRL